MSSTSCSAVRDGHHIETARDLMELFVFDVPERRLDHPLLFSRIDRKFRRAEGVARPGLHLNEHHVAVMQGDQVDLAASGAVVPLQDPVSLFHQEPRGPVLAFPAEQLFKQAQRVLPFQSIRATGLKVFRCASQGPCFRRSARCSFVP